MAADCLSGQICDIDGQIGGVANRCVPEVSRDSGIIPDTGLPDAQLDDADGGSEEPDVDARPGRDAGDPLDVSDPLDSGEDADGGQRVLRLSYGVSYPLDPAGIVDGPTTFAAARCEKDEVIVGVEAIVGLIQQEPQGIVQLRVICGIPGVVESADQVGVDIFDTRPLELIGRRPMEFERVMLRCPSKSAIVAVNGRSKTLIDQIRFGCAKLTVSGAFDRPILELGDIVMTEDAGTMNGSQFGPLSCSMGDVATSLEIKHNEFIEQVVMNCKSISLEVDE